VRVWPERRGGALLTADLAPVAAHTLDDYVTALACSPDGAWLAATTAAGQVALYRTVDGAPGPALAGHALDAVALAWAPAGGRFATAGHDGTVRLWSAADGTAAGALNLAGWIEHLAWDGSTNRLAAAAGKTVAVWDGTDLAPLGTWTDHRSAVAALLWHRGELLAAAYGGVVRYRVGTAAPVARYEYQGAPVALAVPPDGSWLVCGNLDQSIHLWPLTGPQAGKTGADLHMWGFATRVGHLAFDHASRWFVNADGATVVVWKLPRLDGARGQPLEWHQTWLSALAPQPRGDLLATGDEAGGLALWRPDRRRTVHTRQVAGGGVTALAWSPDGRTLAAGTREGGLHLWRLT